MQHILIVDDHPLYREDMMSALRTQLAGVEVPGVGSAVEGLVALYAERFPAVARVLLSGQADIAGAT